MICGSNRLTGKRARTQEMTMRTTLIAWFAGLAGLALVLATASIAEARGGPGGPGFAGGGPPGFAVGHGRAFNLTGRPPGWSSPGRKVGWRGRGCPPGLWKQGRC